MNDQPQTYKSRKPQAVKSAIIAKRAQGENITKIAKDLGITRNTTRSIIEQSNIDRLLENGEIGACQLIAKSLDVIDKRLDKQSESAATFILSNTVFSDRYKGKQQAPNDVVVNLAIQNLISTPQPQVLDADNTPQSK